MTRLPYPERWAEARRFQALLLKRKGWKQRAIAEALGVTEGAVSQWLSASRLFGPQALYARPRPGAPCRLMRFERDLIPDFLSHGAEAYGFRGDLWTSARVAYVIRREFGVSYHKDHVGRILRRLRWTPQKPMRRALQRDEAQIRHWRKEVWPELKKKPSGRAVGSLLSMNRASTFSPE